MATYTADVYKGPNKLGSGSIDSAAASLTSYSATNSRLTGTGRNVDVTITTAGAMAGQTFRTRVVTDGGATLTLAHACPF